MKAIFTFSFLFSFLFINAQKWDDIQITSHKIKDNIYMLEGGGGNMGLCFGEDGVLLIDDQFAPLSEKIKAAIRELCGEGVDFIINTHWHGDHTGGNENFAKEGSTIIAHENVRKRLSTDQVRPFGRTTAASPEVALPKMTFNDKMNIHYNGDDIHLIHVHTAHTDGDAFVYFSKANVLHMGDCFFKDRFPYVDREMGGDPDGAIAAVEAAMMLVDDETVIIPGHGSLATKGDLKRYYEMLTTMKERIMTEVENATPEDKLDFEALCKDYESWGTGFINPEKMVKTFFNAYSDK